MPDEPTGQPEPAAAQVPVPGAPAPQSSSLQSTSPQSTTPEPVTPGPTTPEAVTPEALTVVPLRATTDVAVRPVGGSATVVWRRRAEALRAKLPELARNPVLVGASAAAATVVARIAVEVARELLAGDAPGRPARSSTRSAAQTSSRSAGQPVVLAVTAQVVHHIHVVRHEHVVVHSTGPTVPGLPASPRR